MRTTKILENFRIKYLNRYIWNYQSKVDLISNKEYLFCSITNVESLKERHTKLLNSNFSK